MGKFLASEKLQQIKFKNTSPTFSGVARGDGSYKGNPYPFCIPQQFTEENLFPEIRKRAPEYFALQNIKWHDGQNGKPSNHLCSSQICAVNFLFPFANHPDALVKLLRPVFPLVNKMLPVEQGQYVAFEWIGQQNYLGEKVRGQSSRTRGANFTSADAAVLFEQSDGKRHMVLIEWKYTESYGGTSYKIAKSGTSRVSIYQHLFDHEDCPLDKALLPAFDALFYEPFYQFMRQQFLAHEMEKAHELGADLVSVLHIAPAHNTEFRKITSPALTGLGDSATGVWKKLVRPSGRFISVSTEQLFGSLTVNQVPEMGPWLNYIGQRYPWVNKL